jgi:hypothetical protein
MTDSDDVDKPLTVVYAVKDSIISYPQPPQTAVTLELPTAGRSWLLRKTFDPG